MEQIHNGKYCPEVATDPLGCRVNLGGLTTPGHPPVALANPPGRSSANAEYASCLRQTPRRRFRAPGGSRGIRPPVLGASARSRVPDAAGVRPLGLPVL